VTTLIGKAISFAIDAHGEQKRRYTGEPYWRHPMRVADWLVATGTPWAEPWGDEVIAAAWLHDVVEDTPVTIEEIETAFGPKVAQLVAELTNPSKQFPKLSRVERKKMDREALALASPEAKSIKLADILDNTPSIMEYGKGFAKVYVDEMKLLLPLLQNEGHPLLFCKASHIINKEFP
jgi:(p)ppGpp synthase/HD superfamily hydrolase